MRRAVNAQPPPCRCGTDGSPRRVWRLLRGPRRRPWKPISSATAPVSGEYPSVIAGPGSDGGRPGTRHHRPPRQTRRVQKPDHAAEDHELVAQDEDLHVLSGVTAGEQHEQLDGTPQREVGELRQHQDGLPGRGSRAPPYRAVDANWQLNGHVRLCAPFRQQEGLVAVAAKEIVGHGASYLFAPLTPNVLVLKRQTTGSWRAAHLPHAHPGHPGSRPDPRKTVKPGIARLHKTEAHAP